MSDFLRDLFLSEKPLEHPSVDDRLDKSTDTYAWGAFFVVVSIFLFFEIITGVRIIFRSFAENIFEIISTGVKMILPVLAGNIIAAIGLSFTLKLRDHTSKAGIFYGILWGFLGWIFLVGILITWMSVSGSSGGLNGIG